MQSETISRLRAVLLGLTGLGCLAYAVAALAMGRPDPVAWYWPSALGLASGGAIALASVAAGRSAARAAADELFRAVWGRAQGQAYWLSLALFAALGFAAATGAVGWATAYAAQGCLMGAAYLLLFVWNDLRLA